MSDPRAPGPWLRRFLAGHVVTERNPARSTRPSCRDTFRPPVPFPRAGTRRPAGRTAPDDPTPRRVPGFPAHLEEGRGRSVRTRNQRLAAARAFARFVASRDPARLEWSAGIRSTALRKATPQPVGWLGRAEMEAPIKVPNRGARRGRTEHAPLLFPFSSAARVSEATGPVKGNLRIGRRDGRHAPAMIHGKGGKRRRCPLWPRTGRALSGLLQGRADGDAVFLGRQRRPYTRFGVYRLVARCAARVPELEGRKVTPHMVRHTGACLMPRSGIDLDTIRSWPGHQSPGTTDVHAGIDPGTKARAMALCGAAEEGPDRPWKEDRGLMAFLDPP